MVSRFAAYGASSMSLAATVVANALYTKANFYAAAVGIGKSSGALMVLANFALFMSISAGMMLKSVFFGRLRPVEHEHLYEKLWFFLTESLLALTIFRDDFDAPFVLTYGLLLFLKCFHWITADRVEYIDQIPPPGPPALFHVRVVSITMLLTLADILLVAYSLDSIMVIGVSGMVLFAAEFMILLASITSTFCKYIVSVMDLRRARGQEDAPPWEEKSMYIFYIDLATDFAKLATYITFFTVILIHYGLPLHILRDVYSTLRSFIRRCGDLVRYRRATRDMDVLYPDATRADLDRNGDQTCIICREEMVPREPNAPQQPEQAQPQPHAPAPARTGPNETPKKLSCGHVFHFHCLRSWLERQQSCPTCRHPVLRSAPARTANANPPAPVPGARPVALEAGAPQPTPAAGAAAPVPGSGLGAPAANPIADPFHQFQQYFHLPEPAQAPGDAPMTGVPAAPGAVPAATTQGSGIWGGSIMPGQFGPAAGEPPRVLRHGQQSRRAGSSTTARKSRPAAGGPSRQVPQPRSEPMQSRQASLEGGEQTLNIPFESPMLSGANTPLTSNPPNVFSSTSQVRQADGSAFFLETPSQRAAAAAQRRLGGALPAPSAVAEPGRSSSNEQPSVLQMSTPEPKSSASASTSQVRPLLVPLYSADSLTSVLPPPHPSFSPSDSKARMPPPPPPVPADLSATDFEELSHQTAQGLEARIRFLHDLDGMIYKMLGDLTRVQSVWPEAQAAQEPAEVVAGDGVAEESLTPTRSQSLPPAQRPPTGPVTRAQSSTSRQSGTSPPPTEEPKQSDVDVNVQQ